MRKIPPYLFSRFVRIQACIHSYKNTLLALFFPWPCVMCGELQRYPEVICETCSVLLPRIQSRVCRICGTPLRDDWRIKVCPECKTNRPKLTRIRSGFLYEGPIIEMIRQVKFARRARPIRFFSEELYPVLLRSLPRAIGAIVPVPLHRKREWERTFNQSRLLASYLHELSGIPLRDVLVRTKNTKPQTSLSGAARRRNLMGAFAVKRNARLPQSIVLIDDVITTGATLESCARLLRRKTGVKRIYALTIARAILKT